jgi:hypothetical protein
MVEETYNAGDLVELVHNTKIVRLTTDKLDNDHYGASLDINSDWPEGVYGSAIYIHHTDIFRRVNENKV